MPEELAGLPACPRAWNRAWRNCCRAWPRLSGVAELELPAPVPLALLAGEPPAEALLALAAVELPAVPLVAPPAAGLDEPAGVAEEPALEVPVEPAFEGSVLCAAVPVELVAEDSSTCARLSRILATRPPRSSPPRGRA